LKILLTIIGIIKNIRHGNKILDNPRKYGIIKITGMGKYNFDDTEEVQND
jgi:hypothetical protein